MVSQFWAGGESGMLEQNQESPSDTPLTWVRVSGQIAERPSIRTAHKVGRGIMGIDAACVLGCDSKKSARFSIRLRRILFPSPIIFPGLPSTPKSSLSPKEPVRRITRPARPSKPAIGFESETCRALASDWTLIFLRPSAST